MIRELTAEGMRIRTFDPVAATRAAGELDDNDLVEIVGDEYEAVNGADALAVVTEWNQFRNPDFERIKRSLTAPLIFDGRNLYSPSLMAGLGFAYFCIGRPDPKRL
jgi:UDPglucose 6-dehydrogenase